ncbi:hypothetical protein Sme01_06470 [Sphaerisporangium melleum]|uniref:DUF4352 domain-containing protein n=1 Tax=Sphaerisporangium melleum TaxID=321316 RepID=A0A917VSH8_9ACTN|nr:DUF4352 domain-containing protein [Sphaerisporangium melleum]GGL14255.1 hypothetical protein GCM10007964_65320 [Sphaerisporangium melleum]GII68171.1 hypothetical protein Sme01_06470 [Sphaerisporangium melleum]
MHGDRRSDGVPPYGYAQPYPQTVVVRKKGGGCLRAFLIGAAVMAGLIILGSLLSRGGDAPESAGTGPAAASAPVKKQPRPKRAGIGDVVKDGRFAFKVTRVEKGLTQVGEGFTISKAQGRYVLVHLVVKNIGDEAQLFSDSAQKLIDAKGRQYDAASGAAALGLKDSNAFLNNINPGNSVRGILLFDVPKDLHLRAVELHDSIFSDGTTVTLP